MTPIRLFSAVWPTRRALVSGGFLLVAGVLAGCAPLTSRTTEPPPEPVAERARAEQVQDAYRRLDADHQQLEVAHQQLLEENRQLLEENRQLAADTQRLQRESQMLHETARRRAASTSPEEELARLRLQLLEKDAQIKLLGQKLDAAILEVVRTLAKLRSLESKAEAATNLAEAEIAVKMLAARDKVQDVAHAENLLKMGAQEFRKDNYSGALYLSTQAKSLIKEGQPGPVAGAPAARVEGEVPFALPLPLRLIGRAEAREGPGATYKVAFPFPNGAPVVAHSYKGLWVRIRGDDGRSGWVRHNLIGPR